MKYYSFKRSTVTSLTLQTILQYSKRRLPNYIRLNIDLSNYVDVAPDIINGNSISTAPETGKASTTLSSNLSQLLNKPFWIWNKEEHRQQASSTNGNVVIIML